MCFDVCGSLLVFPGFWAEVCWVVLCVYMVCAQKPGRSFCTMLCCFGCRASPLVAVCMLFDNPVADNAASTCARYAHCSTVLVVFLRSALWHACACLPWASHAGASLFVVDLTVRVSVCIQAAWCVVVVVLFVHANAATLFTLHTKRM